MFKLNVLLVLFLVEIVYGAHKCKWINSENYSARSLLFVAQWSRASIPVFLFRLCVSVKCSIHSFPSSCPEHTICTQKTGDSETAECNCPDNLQFNSAYNGGGKSDYCIDRPMASKKLDPTNSYSATATVDHPASNELAAADSIGPAASTKQQRAPSSHHIISGILVSILIVTAFILTVIAVKKLRLRQRFREFGISQRNRPLYEDVMMGNDTDDPPLI